MTYRHKRWFLRGLGVIALATLVATGLLASAALPASRGSSSSNSKAVRGSSWASTATQLRGMNGRVFTFRCPRNGSAHHVWGTGVYTDDSSVCTAAVHAGRITLVSGGMVKISIRAGRSSYKGTTRHGITSHRWGRWHGSFVVVSATALPKPATTTNTTTTQPVAPTIGWGTNAVSLRGQNGSRFDYICPAGDVNAWYVWGTDTYTDDSSICTAAVHAGRIPASGGAVTIEIRPGLSSYVGSTRNGVTTYPYAAWYGSYVFV
jgi:hypothetical protein